MRFFRAWCFTSFRLDVAQVAFMHTVCMNVMEPGFVNWLALAVAGHDVSVGVVGVAFVIDQIMVGPGSAGGALHPFEVIFTIHGRLPC